MNIKQKRTIILEVGLSLIGVIIIALGLATIVIANTGLDPWGISFRGALNAYNTLTPEPFHIIQYGDMITILSIIFVFIASFLKKERVKWLSIVSGLVLGQFVNIWLALWSFLTLPTLYIGTINSMNYLVLCIAIVILSLGSAITLHFPLFMTPVDYLVLAITTYFPNKAYGIVRVWSDTSAAVIGAIVTLIFTRDITQIGLGIGTVIMFFMIGRVINMLYVRLEHFGK